MLNAKKGRKWHQFLSIMAPNKQKPFPFVENHEISPINNTSIQYPISNQRYIFFRIGPFRFGVHGVAGIVGLVAVSYGLYLSNNLQNLPSWLTLSIVVSTLSNAVRSYGLLSQVPTTSHISSWIFPPHRQAFKRSIAIVCYLNLRLVHQWEWIWKCESVIFPLILLCYTNYHFFPLQPDFANGNTWVFVMPMFIAFNIDTFHQFPALNITKAFDGDNVFSSIMKLPKIDIFEWERVHKWNDDRINEAYLLLTMLCTLQAAFMFTVAFRGRMSIKSCYWIAALEVGLLCLPLIQ